MNDHILKPVIEKMHKQGETEEEIAKTLASLTQAATVLLYKEAVEALSDEDMEQIEDCPDDETANKLIAGLYAKRVGTSPEELMSVFMKEFVKKFLEEN